MNSNEDKKKILNNLKSNLIKDFLNYINSISFTLDEEGSLTITKPNDLTLFKKKRDKNE